MTSYRELRRKILSLLSKPPFRYNVPYLALLFHVDRTTIHHVIRPLVKRGIIHKEVYDGLTWISLRSHTLYETLKYDVEFYTRKIRRKGVDLIKDKRVSQTVLGNSCSNHHGVFTQLGDPQRCIAARLSTSQPEKVVSKQQPGRANSRIKWPKRSHWARVQAFRILVRRRQLTIDDWVMLNKLFNAYLEDTGHRTIILTDDEGRTLWLPYKHRFTRSGIKKLLKKFYSVFDNANRFTTGVWLTLTVDPKKYNNIIEMRYELQKAWNRFMSWVRKKTGKRPPYLRVIEFTKTGLVHYHVILLGIKRLGDKKTEITPELERIGFGKINYMYVVINRNGKWIPKKLLDLKQGKSKVKADGAGLPSNLKSYLKKYLMKAFNDLDIDSMSVELEQVNPITLYWALNSRFFTYSRQIKPMLEIHIVSKLIIYDREIGFRFLGSGYVVNPEVLPHITDDPPWNYFIDYTFPPIYDPSFEL